jgi:hypothetical protein
LGRFTAEEGIGVQRGLKLAGRISPGDSSQDLAVLGARARVARPATTAAFLEQVLTGRLDTFSVPFYYTQYVLYLVR